MFLPLQTYPDFFFFFGRFHPLVVHLPIGMLFLVFIMELYQRKKKHKELESAIQFGLFWIAISAILSSALGTLLALEGGYESELLNRHRWSGYLLTVFACLIYFLFKKQSKAYFPFLCLNIVALIVTGHFGGSLTHGSQYLTDYQPKSISSWISWPANNQSVKVWNDSTLVYSEIIEPILKQKCLACHRTGKSKGELLMETPEQLLKGGKSGASSTFTSF